MTESSRNLLQLRGRVRHAAWNYREAFRTGRSRLVRPLDPLRDLIDPDRRRLVPSNPDDLLRYQERFTDTARLFDVFLRRTSLIEAVAVAAPADEEATTIVVMPWWGAPTPWYAIALGLGLARRGRPVSFVWHDPPFPDPARNGVPQHAELLRVMTSLARRFRVIRLSAVSSNADPLPDDAVLLDGLADQNIMWLMRGGELSADHMALRDQMRDHLAKVLPKVRSLMTSTQPESVVVCGGVIGASGLYLAVGQAAGVRVSTFDAGLGATAIDVDGVAAQHPDAVLAFDMLAAESRAVLDEAVSEGRAEFDRRRSGLDRDRYQLATSAASTPTTSDAILIPLSVIFDAAALGRHRIFDDSREWLVESVAGLLRETTDPIVIRQHPSERKADERSRFDARAVLADAFGDHPQLRFIAAEEDVSTYDLVDSARLVLPFVSTIGIEAAALGKPVIVGGDVYYSGLGFVWAPQTREEYAEVLARGARGDLPPLPGQVDLAWRSYYLTAVCQRVWTDFTPQPPDFWRWVLRQPEELYDDPDVADILTALEQGTPLSILRHRRRHRPATSRPSPD